MGRIFRTGAGKSHTMLGTIVVVLLILGLAYWYKTTRKYAGMPVPPIERGLIPYVGVGLNFALGPPLQYATEMYKKHGEVFTMELFGKRLTFLVGSSAHKPFFQKTDEELSQDEPYRFCVPIFGPGVVYDAEPSVRRQQLRFISKSLKGDALRSYVPLIVSECEEYFRAHWASATGEVDLRDMLSELIILTASRTLMGKEIREQLFTEVAKLYQDLDEGLTPISVFFPYLPLPAHKRRDAARLEMVKIFGRIMDLRRANPHEEHSDVLQVFMDSRYRDDRELTKEEVAGLMIALLFAGQHTSSVTSSWTALLLLANRQFIEPLLAEQKRLAEEHHELCYDSIKEMHFLHACVKEALRMYPPLIFVMREVIEPFYHGDFLIPKGDVLFVSPALSMRLGSGQNDLGKGTGAFANPDKFDPYRFFERKEDDAVPYSYLGFGAGHHACLGEQFAYVQIKAILSTIFRFYDLELVGKLPEPDYRAMVVGPEKPCRVKYTRLEKPRW